MLVREDGTAEGNLGGGAFEALVVADARQRLLEPHPEAEVKRYYFTEKAVRGEPTGMVCGGMAEVFLEVMTATPVLTICGGGPVGQALAAAGEVAGYDLVVAEDRAEFRQDSLFPAATTCVEVDRNYSQDFLSAVRERELYVAVVTRCWETDSAALAAVLRQQVPHLRYVGVLGSRRKIVRVREEVERQGLALDGVDLRAPIGLPLGGDSPGEIAISILAEIQQLRYAAQERAGPTARRLPTSSSSTISSSVPADRQAQLASSSPSVSSSSDDRPRPVRFAFLA